MEINCKYCPKNDGTGACNIDDCPLTPIIQEMEEISGFLNITCQNNPVEIQERIAATMVYVVRTGEMLADAKSCLLYTSPSPRYMRRSGMPSSA